MVVPTLRCPYCSANVAAVTEDWVRFSCGTRITHDGTILTAASECWRRQWGHNSDDFAVEDDNALEAE